VRFTFTPSLTVKPLQGFKPADRMTGEVAMVEAIVESFIFT
jgi:hypothetical protein